MEFVASINGALRRFPIWPVYIVALLPPLVLLWQGVNGGLGVDPVKAIEHKLGELALQLVILGLTITPLRRFAGLNLLKYRRAIGLVAFFYMVLHFLTWLVLDMGLLWGQALGDIVKRPYITVGMAALLLMVPLAITSNDAAIRRMGAAAWRRLHKLVYPAAILAAVHYIWLVKAWPLEPFVYLGTILVLLALRAVPKSRRIAA